jgi:hypothetical protein
MSAPKKFVTIKEDVNHNRVGCTFSYFAANLENKPLQVIWEDKTKVNAQDATGKVFTLLRSDVEPSTTRANG